VLGKSVAVQLIPERAGGERCVADGSHWNAVVRQFRKYRIDVRSRDECHRGVPDSIFDRGERLGRELRHFVAEPIGEQKLRLALMVPSGLRTKCEGETVHATGVRQYRGDAGFEIERAFFEERVADIE